jgi:hypothetical protein
MRRRHGGAAQAPRAAGAAMTGAAQATATAAGVVGEGVVVEVLVGLVHGVRRAKAGPAR